MLTLNRTRPATVPTARPKRAPLVNPFHAFVRAFLCLAAAFLVLPLAVLPFDRFAGIWAEMFGGIFGVTMLIAALVSGMLALSASRRLKRFRQGDYWAHWTYTRDEWLTFAEDEWARRRRASGKGPLAGLVIGGFTGLVCGAATGFGLSAQTSAVVLGALAGGTAFGLVGALLGWLGGCAARYAAWRDYRRMQNGVGETYVGADAAYCDGYYWSWTMGNMRLERVALVPGRVPVLAFTLRAQMGKAGEGRTVYRVPVPAGREAEARWILHGLCGG